MLGQPLVIAPKNAPASNIAGSRVQSGRNRLAAPACEGAARLFADARGPPRVGNVVQGYRRPRR